MAGNPSVKKREKERARQQRKREKEAKRQQRKEEKSHRSTADAGDEDPDIAGIVPGPQPLAPEFSDLEDAEAADDEGSEDSEEL